MTTQPEIFRLEKNIWTHEDFEVMGWHDSNIYGLTFENSEDAWTSDLIFDIDYIFKWVQPVAPTPSFTFWVSPCTLIFKEAFALQIDLNTENYTLDGLEIADIELLKKDNHESGTTTYHWNIILQTGTIKFQSQGFTQVVRKKPVHISGQSLNFEERGGINFGRNPY